MSGSLNRHGEHWKAVPREVVANSQGVESIIFELARPNDLSRISFVKKWWRAIRPESLASICMPWLATLLYGVLQHWTCSIGLAISSLLGGLFFRISVNVLNDVEDHLRLVDLPGTFGGSGVIQKGWLSAKQMRQFGHMTLALGVICGLPAVLNSPQILILLGLLSVFGVMSFSGRPFDVKYRVFGDLSIFAFLGPLLSIGFSAAAFSRWDAGVLFQGLFFGFLTWGNYFAKHLQDFEANRTQGFRNLASWFGFKKSRHFLATIYGFAFLSVGLGVGLHYFPVSVGFLTLCGTPWVVQLVRRVYRASGPVSALLVPVRNEAIRCQFYLGLLLSLALLLDLYS
jgi:1,4-dihydroxy-2-naphthoate octaprenyltransferase